MNIKSLDKLKISLLIVVLFSAFLFFFSLGQRSLWDPDEPRYAEAARVMVETGNYLTPYFNESVRFDKPPLFYWFITAAYKVFGINEFSARFFSGLFAFLGVILVFILAKLLLDPKAGLISAFILATSGEYLVLANIASTDMTFSFFVGLCLFFFLLGYKNVKGGGIFYILSYVSMSLAVLTKGPIGVVLPVLVIGCFILITRQLKLVLRMRILLGMIIFFLISAPWYYLIYKTHGTNYSDTFFVYHNVSRFLSDKFHHQEPFYYFILIIAVGFLPWALFLPNALFELFRKKAVQFKEEKNEWIFIFLWFFVPFLFFSISKAKLATYVLPCFMPLALIVGKFWREKLFNRFAGLFIGIVLIIGIVGVLPIEKIAPKFLTRRTTKQVSVAVGKVIKPEERLGSFGIFKPSMVYYSHHKVDLLGEENIIQFLKSEDRVYCILKSEDLPRIKDKAGIPLYTVAENERLVAVTNRQE